MKKQRTDREKRDVVIVECCSVVFIKQGTKCPDVRILLTIL